MPFDKPKSRTEAILQNILGADNELESPKCRMEELLQSILNNTEYTKTAKCRAEEILLAIKNGGEYDRTPMARDEKILYAILTDGEYTDPPKSRLEELLLMWLEQGAGEEVTYSGTTISLSNVIKLLGLKAFGKCVQASTPTPDTPQDIACNNGMLRMVDDELPYGYKRLSGIQMQDARIVVPFYLTGEDTLRFRAQGTSGNWIGSFNDAYADDNLSFYGSTSSGAKYARYNGQTGGSSIYTNTWYDVVVSPTGVTGTRNPSSFTPATFTCSEPLNIGATSIEGTPGPNVSFEGNIVVDGRLTLIPCERESDNALGYYDGTTFYTSEIGTMTSLGYDASHLVLGIVGTPEVITLGAQTASAENLLAVGDYKDEQEIITGSVTRKVGVEIFDGTESWEAYSVVGTYRRSLNGKRFEKSPFISTHFAYSSGISSEISDGEMMCGAASSNAYFRKADMTTLTDFKAWLAAQYAAGTPVIVIYPLAEETTETVTAQPLTFSGSGTASASGSVEDLVIEVKAKAKT